MADEAKTAASPPPSRRRRIGLQVAGAVGVLGLIALIVVLDPGEPLTPSDEVRSFVAGLRGGQRITPLETTDETAAVLELLRRSTGESVVASASRSTGSSPSDLESGSACVVLDVDGSGARRRVNVLLRVHEGVWTLAEVSTRRRCRCPGLTETCVMPR